MQNKLSKIKANPAAFHPRTPSNKNGSKSNAVKRNEWAKSYLA